MSAATAREAPKFVRRTSLNANEYHTNFRKIDCETISRLTSDEAARVTTQMCKVYLSFLNAPAGFWEREGVLRFTGEEKGSEWVTAWEQIVTLAGVASATARKALRWMHGQGIIGYFAGKNGVGIRVFMNRAAASIGVRPERGQKNLRLVPASTEAPRASTRDTPFNDSYAVLEVLEKDLNPRAPKSGAGSREVVNHHNDPCPSLSLLSATPTGVTVGPLSQTAARLEVPFEDVVSRLKRELEPALQSAARQAAAQEHGRTREWLESKGLPKAARVAQREAYDVLRRHGLISASPKRGESGSVDARGEPAPSEAKRLSAEEARELAEVCVAMLEVHGQGIDATLCQLRAEAEGPLLAEDEPRVRELALILAGGGRKE